ncbi:bifunctional phosphoribosylaminoimidazolecarboxamide formyltransferase/IMP cyclohydrolase [Alkaliphilus serpentinus]|uniref:Bifunctional purine biosynthesis protein PurH n=1 Tax=Alkaliphilus serpentinus TaxID=1482731 RepID=A0A833M878_9FIRM|nr:bifunctional phosphoribosylaminoimidazolecarboxamide formyltransferase/IMP cyclohydrolase [Alkaliphilus serpentinus]KAB3532113.1 bifunctional phosphoribosylaminoimidazolecarboxamide formyltransferase/IMP cyclohydrolase [Alkaliphilus serpentinus]
MIKRALISVSDKSGIVDFAKSLAELGVEIISTGGTAKLLRDSGVKAVDVSDITSFPECLDGRVKTLHPAIHGGILAIRDNKTHMDTIKEQGITPIDLVVINLYPFKETILKEGVTLEEAIENIDIGGPTMLRSAAKNYRDVTVVVNPEDYQPILSEIKDNGDTLMETRYQLALKVFRHTSHYDTLIASYLGKNSNDFPETLTLTYEKLQDLRYGENPHQRAAYYRQVENIEGGLTAGIQLQGKELSFNNINDANGALQLLKEFQEPTVVAIKHTNPCGVVSGSSIHEAYIKAYKADPQSIFGGIIAANEIIDGATAKDMMEIFLEVIIAPDFTADALEIFKKKKNIRLIKLQDIKKGPTKNYDIKRVSGGILIQDENLELFQELRRVTANKPTDTEMEDLLFAYKVVKHTKSNGIVIAKNKQTLAIGPGQSSRIWALENAIKNSPHPLKGSVLASDAFFPFKDCVEAAAKAGIAAIIQPGGSKKDEESIEACDEAGIAMIFTGMRHFKH